MTSNPKSAEDIAGFEYDWLATDADDHVALFSTAGGGFAPAEFLSDTEAHEVALNAILGLPESTSVRFAPDVTTGVVNTWRRVAERGLFAFDADPYGGPYRVVAAPLRATKLNSPPDPVAAIVARLRLSICFEAHETIRKEQLER
jgi:hypothetical protein